MIGKKFGRLTVVRRGRSNAKHLWWICQCDCPKQTLKQVRGDGLRNGSTRSCGCLHRDVMAASGNHYPPGTKFGRLTVIKEIGKVGRHRRYFCRCRCGNHVSVGGRFLLTGDTKSCGCLYRETRKANYKHGQSPSTHKIPVYSCYQRQKSWCRNPNDRHWKYYGGRSILFLFPDFPTFYAHVGDKPGPDYWLMRKDRDGNFCEGNLVWVRKHRKEIGNPNFELPEEFPDLITGPRNAG
jgi:hypothetical protein